MFSEQFIPKSEHLSELFDFFFRFWRERSLTKIKENVRSLVCLPPADRALKLFFSSRLCDSRGRAETLPHDTDKNVVRSDLVTHNTLRTTHCRIAIGLPLQQLQNKASLFA